MLFRDAPAAPPAIGTVGEPMRESDVTFWARQFSEHALFFSLGIEDQNLRQQATALHADWERARPSLTAGTIMPLAVSLRAYKTELLARLDRGEWLGWIFPLFVAHTRRELDLFITHLNGTVPAQQDTIEWLRFMAEHAAFAAHLMDPTEASKIRTALAAVRGLEQIRNACITHGVSGQILTLSNHAGEQLDQFVGRDLPKARSVIHPVLATHVLREGRRFLYTIQKLRQQR